jgi:class 3 adenylate cyclase/pimeloyl-ACP methyl ester carboxylesterase
MRWPRARYADANGVSIAYEVAGDGVVDVISIGGVVGGLLQSVLDPRNRDFHERVAAFSRHIRFDRRGQGFSDPLQSGPVPPLEQEVEDIVAVMESARSRRAALWAGGDGCQVALLFAAMYPDRVLALVLQGGYARLWRTDDYPIGVDPSLREEIAREMREQWGDLDNPWGIRMLAPNRLHEPGFRELFAQSQQISSSKAAAIASIVSDRDVREVLPLVQAPTLVLASDAPGDRRRQVDFLTEHIPNARMYLHEGEPSYMPDYSDADFAEFEEFLTGTRTVPVGDRALATVLFTDIVSSTQRVAEIGDRAWRALLDRLDELAAHQLERFRGRLIKTLGDGILATFDGPQKAINCAQAIARDANGLGLQIRSGVHTGEMEMRRNDIAGVAVHAAQRICATASGGEILVSRTVVDLTAGSGIRFEAAGEHSLKGLPGTWTVFAVGSLGNSAQLPL